MKKVDSIIVGLGLAGVAYATQMLGADKSFVVLADDSQTASVVAGGLYNPTILKRFTAAWKAQTQLDQALPFYAYLERLLGGTYDYQSPILRRFASVAEQNLWFQAADKPSLAPFLSTTLVENSNKNLSIPHKFGKVRGTGRVDTKTLLKDFKAYLTARDLFVEEHFDYEALLINSNGIQYGDLQAQRIVFAEGYGLKNNPYFNGLPLEGTKGEVLTLRISDLKESLIIKSGVFVIPLGEDLYRVGSTYFWRDKTLGPSADAKEFLLSRLEKFMKLPYEIVSHSAGIRPTVSDRRPLVGVHPTFKNLYVLNGMGSRGVLIAPSAAKVLFEFIYASKPIDPEMDIARFSALL